MPPKQREKENRKLKVKIVIKNALVYLVKQYDIKELHIPYYLCDVVRHALVEAGCKPIFYHIDDNFMPVKNFLA